MDQSLSSWQKQPTEGSIVWQHNRLAEARYELSPREQKLLLYVIAMIEADDDELKRYAVNISQFADLAGLDKRHLYTELRDLAEGLKSKVLVIPGHYDAETNKHVDLITNWFADVYIARNGEGYFAVEISKNLRTYLLQVKQEFYRFRLEKVMQMRSGYAIRMYQWLKRWEFRHRAVTTVQNLRAILGTVQIGKYGKIDMNLAPYADFKRRAIKPAVQEINVKSDIKVSFTEIKANGSKAVERLVFTIGTKKGGENFEMIQLPPAPQLELELVSPENERFLSELGARYGLSRRQRATVEGHLREKGEGYVREKGAIVDLEPRENAAKAFLAALRDDWQFPVKIRKDRRLVAASDQTPASISEEAIRNVKAEAAALYKRLSAIT